MILVNVDILLILEGYFSIFMRDEGDDGFVGVASSFLYPDSFSESTIFSENTLYNKLLLT